MKKDVKVILIFISLFFLWTSCIEKKIKLGNDINFDKGENIHYKNTSLFMKNVKNALISQSVLL